MKIAELIKRLQEIRLDHGDVDVQVAVRELENEEHAVSDAVYLDADAAPVPRERRVLLVAHELA